jgi:hypothetical protein
MTILNFLNLYCTFAASYFHYVSPHSPGSILFAASHGQRPHIAYQTITLSTQSTFFFCGYLTVPPSTGLDTPGHYAPSTSHPTTRFEAYAADGGHKPVLQHFGT